MEEKIKNSFEDLFYLTNELKDTLVRTRRDIPEDFYKVFLDLVYHTNRTLKEMESDYDKFIETWHDSLCKVSRF